MTQSVRTEDLVDELRKTLQRLDRIERSLGSLDNSGVLRTVMSSRGTLAGGAGGVVYGERDGISMIDINAALDRGWAFKYLDPEDYDVVGISTKFRFAAQLLANATDPATLFGFGLVEITSVFGAANVLDLTNSGYVTGSAVVIDPDASLPYHDESSLFELPSAGYYMLAMNTSGAQAANSRVAISMQLEMIHE